MKRKRAPEPDWRLFRKIELLLMSDLSDPGIEATARAVLATLRERGYPIDDPDIDDPNCLPCLHLALLSAVELTPLPMMSH
jgi:hypothetical protein